MLTTLLALSPAHACGGFFCNAVAPVEQAGEEIVFAVDSESNRTDMHVRVQYAGPPQEFAWLVPVAEQPTLGTGTDRLFDALAVATQPQYTLDVDTTGCEEPWQVTQRVTVVPAPALDSSESDPDGGISVVEQAVGPYDTAVLQGDSEEAILTWLQDNGYAVPSSISSRLGPYIASRHYFVALKLQPDSDLGDLVPITLSFEGTTPSVPLTLTGVAATPDMPVRIYMLGEHRAVPTNYLHVVPNDATVDWFQTWLIRRSELVARAADEAGGQAFATDFAGPAEGFADVVMSPTWTADGLADATTPTHFVNAIMGQGVPFDAALMNFFGDVMPLNDDSFGNFAYQCPECVDLDSLVDSFDPVAAAAAFDSRILDPMRDARALFTDGGVLTRLTSSMSPDEMTLDPMFGTNPDMPASVDLQHTARLTVACDPGESAYEAPMRLELEDGHPILIPSFAWLDARGITPSEWIGQLGEPFAVRIESTGTSGQPEVLFDGRDIVEQQIDDLNDDVPNSERADRRGCGCSNTASGVSGALFAGLLGLLATRRR